MNQLIIILFLVATIQTFAQISISGKVSNLEGAGICEAVVTLTDSVGTIQLQTTDNNGNYQFSNLEIGNSYELSVEKNNAPLNGISVFDLVLIGKHIMGEVLIGNPFILFATDIDESGSITVRDMVILRKLILQISSNLPNKNWQFFPTSFQFPNPVNPWEGEVIQTINYSNVSASINNANFVGYKSGDTNPTALPCGN